MMEKHGQIQILSNTQGRMSQFVWGVAMTESTGRPRSDMILEEKIIFHSLFDGWALQISQVHQTLIWVLLPR